MIDKIEGADAAALTQAVQRHYGRQPAQNGAAAPARAAPAGQAAPQLKTAAASQRPLEQRLNALVNKQPVMLFMKVLCQACVYAEDGGSMIWIWI